jgi:hypothetical protein
MRGVGSGGVDMAISLFGFLQVVTGSELLRRPFIGYLRYGTTRHSGYNAIGLVGPTSKP